MPRLPKFLRVLPDDSLKFFINFRHPRRFVTAKHEGSLEVCASIVRFGIDTSFSRDFNVHR